MTISNQNEKSLHTLEKSEWCRYGTYSPDQLSILSEKIRDSRRTHSNNATPDILYKELCLLRTLGLKVVLIFKAIMDEFEEIYSEAKPGRMTKEESDYYDELISDCYYLMKNIGFVMCITLDEFQDLGGSFESLCNLCNISVSQGLKKAGNIKNKNFSKIVFEYELDYEHKAKERFIEYNSDSPFSVCIHLFVQLIQRKKITDILQSKQLSYIISNPEEYAVKLNEYAMLYHSRHHKNVVRYV